MKHLIYILSSIFLLHSCSDENNQNPIDPEPPFIDQDTTIGSINDLNDSMLRFSWEAFKELYSDFEEEQNVLFSPISIQTALYMTLNGARETTLDGMLDALQLQNINVSGVNENFQSLIEEISSSTEATLNTSNVVFSDPKMSIDEQYEEVISTYYDAEFNELNFGDPASVEIINQWADEKTEGRIPEILEEIEEDEVMFLINALFYKGDWENGFPEFDNPVLMDFQTADGNQIQVPSMSSDANRSFYLDDELEAIDLQFKGGEFSMTFMRPLDQDLSVWVSSNTSEDFVEIYKDLFANKLQENRVLLTLPKFEVRSHYLLKDVLQRMGMDEAFNESNADLYGLGTACGNLYINRVIHDAFLKIDERGAEGAAVTTVSIAAESAPPRIIFDSPFVFFIRHIQSNAIVFQGIIGNPESI